MCAIVIHILMRFEQGAVKQIAHAALEGMVFCNLLRHAVEHSAHVHEFNGMLMQMLNYMEMDARVRRRILNPDATMFQYNKPEVVNTLSSLQNTESVKNNATNE